MDFWQYGSVRPVAVGRYEANETSGKHLNQMGYSGQVRAARLLVLV